MKIKINLGISRALWQTNKGFYFSKYVVDNQIPFIFSAVHNMRHWSLSL